MHQSLFVNNRDESITLAQREPRYDPFPERSTGVVYAPLQQPQGRVLPCRAANASYGAIRFDVE